MCLKGELTKASKILCCTVKFSVAPGLQEVIVYVRELLESKTEESIVNITPSCRLQSFYIRNSWKELLHEDALHRTEVLSLHVPSLILDVFSSSFLVLFTHTQHLSRSDILCVLFHCLPIRSSRQWVLCAVFTAVTLVPVS